MEFLRFGSSIPGSYWGCCAVCIIQNFKVDPEAKASIQLVSGDGGGPLTEGSEMLFAGPTYADIFKQRIRIGTFSNRDMPNHGFLAVLTKSQVSGGVGAKWLKILKEEGFEFIRTVDNSVYTGPTLDTGHGTSHENYIFGLFRNIGNGRIKDPFTPPKEWTNLPRVVPEVWELAGKKDRQEISAKQDAFQLDRWKANGPTKLLKEKDIEKAGAPVILAGLRSPNPQESKETRAAKLAAKSGEKPKTNAFPVASAVAG